MSHELQALHQFLSSTMSSSVNTHGLLSASLRSAVFMFEGILATVSKEQEACIRDLLGKMPGSNYQEKEKGTIKTRFQVDDKWDSDSLIKFTCADIEYQVKAPPNIKPGDWLEFDSSTYILTKFDR